ncbi:MutS-related protein [Chitinophaga agri]|uniref:DNA mismatch repair protein n=1 Tax=Chitinophaga agri TaxID=2703787 RepID=A0A6B9ZMW3_9BACT|nr:DNA mismatch repair protein [Chitinophaga agri]QHS63336.1 DNA mismatch repair protein [Chitinophaga agri]
MSFKADKQTLEDLNLTGKFKPNSIYQLFSRIKTTGGERLLEQMFQQPLTDPDAINHRSATFRYFQEQRLTFPFSSSDVQAAENYLTMSGAAGLPSILRKRLNAFLHDEEYEQLRKGLMATLHLLRTFKSFLQQLNNYEEAALWRQVLSDLTWLSNVKELSVWTIAYYDRQLRHRLSAQMEQLLQGIYQLDVYIAVSDVARQRGFHYATALPASRNIFHTTGLRHPALDAGIANAISLDSRSNVIFLTGANMAGKSTLMKSFGIALYLGHMGFPVAAANMEFSVRDGLYSSINVPDNLNMGYSHFYAEVLRVKQVATEVSSGKNLVVIFDELFKGTNVKDAYDATLAVTTAFARYSNCFFLISTHIIEVGQALQTHANLQFTYLPTLLDGAKPRYTYRLTEGITSDRHGMTIIENEQILELLES